MGRFAINRSGVLGPGSPWSGAAPTAARNDLEELRANVSLTRLPSSPVPARGKAEHTRFIWREKAPTSSPSTSTNTSNPNPYPLATVDDLKTTATLVENLGRRCLISKADVRELGELRKTLEDGLSELGHLDVVVANAGILPMAMGDPQPSDLVDATDVDLLGVMNTVAVSLAHLTNGGSVI